MNFYYSFQINKAVCGGNNYSDNNFDYFPPCEFISATRNKAI